LTEGAQFAAVARTLYAAERDAWFGGDYLIDEQHAGFQFVDQARKPTLPAINPGAMKRKPARRASFRA
jgi:hypothetical protein